VRRKRSIAYRRSEKAHSEANGPRRLLYSTNIWNICLLHNLYLKSDCRDPSHRAILPAHFGSALRQTKRPVHAHKGKHVNSSSSNIFPTGMYLYIDGMALEYVCAGATASCVKRRAWFLTQHWLGWLSSCLTYLDVLWANVHMRIYSECPTGAFQSAQKRCACVLISQIDMSFT
jgi:hypothetical protein